MSDPKARALRDDIRRLSMDIGNGKVLYRPAQERFGEDEQVRLAIDRIEAINEMSFGDWQQKRQMLEPRNR